MGGRPGGRTSQHAGEHPQDRVALRVPVTLVDELEVVDVEHDQRERVVVARGGGHRVRELVLEGALVGQVGEPVAGRALRRTLRWSRISRRPPTR